MKKPSEKKAAKKPMSKDEVMDAMIPKRAVEKTAELLEIHKSKSDPRTRAVNSRDYGFKGNNMVLYVLPEATREQITEKFALRFNHTSGTNNFKAMQHKKVPKAMKN